MLAFSHLALLAFSASSAVAIGNTHEQSGHHQPKRVMARRSNSTTGPVKRDYSGQATWFEDGLGACGITNGPNDFIVALNTPQYGSGEDCFKMITITGDNGITQTAQITDECPGCAYGYLDMSQGLFQAFHDLGVGEFPITWDFVGAAAPAPSTSSTWQAPTTTWQPPATTSTSSYVWTPTTTSTPPTTTSKAASTSSSSSSVSSLSGSGSSSVSGASGSQSATGSAASASASASGSGTGSTQNTDSSQTGGNLNAQAHYIANMAILISSAKQNAS